MGPLTLVVLAAGVGSRFGGDKQLEPFGPGGETLLEMNAFDAWRSGVDRMVVVTSERLRPAMERMLERLTPTVSARTVVQGPEAFPGGPVRERPWGTAHAVLTAASPDGPAIVANADDLYGRAAFAHLVEAMRTSHRESGDGHSETAGAPIGPRSRRADAFLVAYRLDRTLSEAGGVSRGVCRLAHDGTLASIEEVVELRDVGARIVGRDGAGREGTYPGEAPVSMNLWGLYPRWWPRIAHRLLEFVDWAGNDPEAEFRLPDAVAAEIEAGALVRAVPTDAHWVGVTHADDVPWVRAEVNRLFDDGSYPSPLFE